MRAITACMGVDESLLDSEDSELSNYSFEELLARVSEEDATMQPIYLNREEAELTRELKDRSMTERRRERIDQRLKPNLSLIGKSSSLPKRAPGRSSK